MKGNFIRFIVIALLSISLSILFAYSDEIYKSFYKGEFYDLVANEKHTLYLFLDENEKAKLVNQDNFKKNIALIGKQYKEELIIRIIEKEDSLFNMYEEKLRLKKYPTIVIINDRGYMSAFYEKSVDYYQLEYIISRLIK